ncbi:xanthine dehydrogenase subunit XdhC [Sporomusa sp.]|uniref:xanthine dehydrogenase subunit XdhC n=1 Tax=Sporomusa sp. TaxID=2078658 RepID=UPI002C047FDA|nr:xanthine dehydrogenase subunit XdhC [Sporomusa sp.]HWR45968.1 xanthine dehydrogenase subunit XdhC [Sporomusa sp.]
MKTKTITCTVNGQTRALLVDIRQSLLEVLRQDLQLTGAKQGCGVGECGACTVLIDGEAYDSCLYLAVWAEGKDIRTIEGEAHDGQLSNVQTAFITEGAVQCGFCTPGVIMSVTALAEHSCQCDRDSLKKELSGHMCRCTGYQNILNAAEKALIKAD